ncbi:hypothetical protein [Streptomyces sp. NPDC057325]|uniref:hypothetical protein n=1 Tax=unclassified Streptomyces TaxID=2593676 RepID=UPI00363F8CD9
MATFPALDPDGTAYHLQLWHTGYGGVPVWVGIPGSPNINSPELDTLVRAFADDLAELLGASVTLVARYRTGREELPAPEPEPTP